MNIAQIIAANLVFWLALTIFGAAAITSLTPKRLYNAANSVFRERSFERKLYKALKVCRWKDLLPVYRHDKNTLDRRRLPSKISREYIDAFIAETCKAEFVHTVLAILGLASFVFVITGIEPVQVFIPVYLLMLCVHTPFIIIQRYNRPRLVKLRGRL